jgi:hypothetical protein
VRLGDRLRFGGPALSQVGRGADDGGDGEESLCQFWKDSNQNCEVPSYPRKPTAGWPWTRFSSL